MKKLYKYKYILVTGIASITLALSSCTKLNQNLYSVVSQNEFWQTPAEIAAGVAPAYVQLTNIAFGNNNVFPMEECSSDEFIVPSRGNDWADAGHWDALWEHTWQPTGNFLDPAWQDIFNGISKCNFILTTVAGLSPAPSTLSSINAEVRTLRAFYYFYAMDLFGNVPLTGGANVNPDSLTNSTRLQVFNFIESELKASLPDLSSTVDNTTYGLVTKYFSYALLAKIYLNAQVYTGTARWADCITYCDSVLQGPYKLMPDYFDNFAPTNGPSSTENIFAVPFDNTNIGGNNWELNTLHYQSQVTFGLTTSPYNGFCTPSAFYNNFDTTSTYTESNGNTYRTFNDMRAGQYLVGQQFTTPYVYPPYQNVLYASTNTALESVDQQTGLLLAFNPTLTVFSSGSGSFRLVGARNIKYFPQSGTAGNQSNDIVLLRLSDILLTKAEAEIRAGTVTDALSMVNQVRERAYGGDTHDWTPTQLTLENILAERARELAWEMVRRQDLIRYEVASGTPYFSAARVPVKTQDVMDGHLYVYPIPQLEIIQNARLKQNPGYQ